MTLDDLAMRVMGVPVAQLEGPSARRFADWLSGWSERGAPSHEIEG